MGFFEISFPGRSMTSGWRRTLSFVRSYGWDGAGATPTYWSWSCSGPAQPPSPKRVVQVRDRPDIWLLKYRSDINFSIRASVLTANRKSGGRIYGCRISDKFDTRSIHSSNHQCRRSGPALFRTPDPDRVNILSDTQIKPGPSATPER